MRDIYSNNNSILKGDIHEQTECWIELGQTRPLFARKKSKGVCRGWGKRGSPSREKCELGVFCKLRDRIFSQSLEGSRDM